jgi:hypothetical protein
MIPKKIIDSLVGVDVYIYIKNIDREFAGVIDDITEDDIIKLKDKYNNTTYIPISEVDIVTERR